MCHLTVHWLSIDSAIQNIFIKSLKIPNLMLKYADQQMYFGRWDECSVVGIFDLYHINFGHTRYWLFLHFMKLTLLPKCLQCYLPDTFFEVDFICWCHSITNRHDCIHICRVWYELFEKQIKYSTLFRVLRWEFASV